MNTPEGKEAVMTRKPIQLVVTVDTEFMQGIFAVLCADGTMWSREIVGGEFVWNPIQFNPKEAEASHEN